MNLRAWLIVGVAIAGCNKKKDQPAATSGSGSAAAPLDAQAADALVADAGAAACIPPPTSFGRIGAELVGCADSDCWTIDPKSGAVTKRAFVHLPGVGFTVERTKLTQPRCYEGLCWPAPAREADADEPTAIWVAYHPDGKRAVVIDDPAGTIFDLETKKPLTTFNVELSNSLGGVWFSGNFVANAGYDAGPYAVLVYHDAKTGKKAGSFEQLFGGAVGITSTGAFVVTSEGMGSVTVVDGASAKGKTTKRKIPAPPAGCEPLDPALDTESQDADVKACVAFANKYYSAYYEATLVDDPTNAAQYIGHTGRDLIVVDKNLVELSRVALSVCPGEAD
jgi:hypothetical protein